MVSLIGAHFTKNGIKQLPARAVLSLNGVGIGGDETHEDTLVILRDTRVFDNGETTSDFHTFDPLATGISWKQYGNYWYSERTEKGGNFKAAWALNPTANLKQIQNEQGGGGTDEFAMQRNVDIERAICWAANEDGHRCGILNLAGGSPDFESWKRIYVPFIMEAWEHGQNPYCRHCYADWFVEDDGSINNGQPQRVINELEYLKSIGYGGGMVLTECGLYGGYGVAEYPYFEQQVTRWEQALRPYADIFIGLAWWETGASEFNADYTDHIKKLLPYIQAGDLPRWTPPTQQPPNGEEPPMEPKNCDLYLDLGRFVHLLPQDTTGDEIATIAKQFNDAKNSFVFSHDDAELIVGHGRGENPEGKQVSEVRIWEPQRFTDDVVGYFASRGYKYSIDYFEGAPPPPLVNIINIVDQLPLAKARFSRTLDQIDAIAIHHFASNSTIQQVHDYHKSLGWPGIGYHFVVDHGGEIYQTIPLDKLGTHVANNNTRSIGVALRGNFTSQAPAQAMLDSARVLVNHLKQLVPTIDEALGHRQFPGASTQCPGNTWAFWLPYVIGGEIVQPEPPPPPPPPPAPTIDAAPYFVPSGQYGHKLVMEVGEGTQPMQLEKRANDVVLRKGDGNWIDGKRYQDSEQWKVSDGQIQKGKDTSDAGNGGKDGYDLGWAQWIPQFVQVGQTYHSTPVVKRFNRTMNCQVFSEVQASDFLHIKALVPTWVSPANPNIILNDVLIVEWRSGTPDLNVAPNEVYYFCREFGYVGWGSHFIVEITEGQAPLTGALDCGM